MFRSRRSRYFNANIRDIRAPFKHVCLQTVLRLPNVGLRTTAIPARLIVNTDWYICGIDPRASSNTFNSDFIGDSSHSSSETVKKASCSCSPVRVSDSDWLSLSEFHQLSYWPQVVVSQRHWHRFRNKSAMSVFAVWWTREYICVYTAHIKLATAEPIVRFWYRCDAEQFCCKLGPRPGQVLDRHSHPLSRTGVTVEFTDESSL